MFKKKCACGKSEKNFKMDIGEFFVGDCCGTSGYDELGNLKEGAKPEQLAPSITDSILDKLGMSGKAPTVNIVPEQTRASEQDVVGSEQLQKTIEPSRLQKVLSFFALGNRVSKSKIKDLKLEELLEIAKSKNVQIPEGATRMQVMALLIGK